MKIFKRCTALLLSLCILLNGIFVQIVYASDEMSMFSDITSGDAENVLEMDDQEFSQANNLDENLFSDDSIDNAMSNVEVFTDEKKSDVFSEESVAEEFGNPVEYTINNGGALDKSVMTILEQSDTGFKVKFQMTDGNEFIYSFQTYSKETLKNLQD